MKKFITMLLVGTLSLSIAACGTSKEEPAPATETAPVESEVVEESEEAEEPEESEVAAEPAAETGLVDGEYTVEGPESDNWQDVVTVTVEGGVIADIVWTGVNAEGKDKIEESKAGNYNMGGELEWYEQAEALEAEVIQNQNTSTIVVKEDGKTDAVAGVSISVDGFVDLVNEAIDQASGSEEASSEEAAEGALTDGEYTAKAEEGDNWQDMVTVTVEGGVISSVVWNGVNAEGKDKIEESKAGNYNMGGELEWYEQAEAVSAEVVQNQGTSSIVVKEDGKTDAVAGVSISVDGFVELANEAIDQAK